MKDSEFSGWIGMSSADITPPVGIYSRNWGAATQHVAMGIHRSLTMNCMVLRETPASPCFVMISVDLGWWKSAADEKELRYSILKEFQLEESNLLICLSHTHAGPVLFSEDADKEGGGYIVPYLALLKDKGIASVREALAKIEKCTLTWRYGTCDLAANRDVPDPEEDGYLVGYNPDLPADNTLLVGRITNASQCVVGTIVNYACHPTTLAWDNQLISPDYIGAMRELVCEKTNQSPCLFIQGASGELAPAIQYTGNCSVADKHGRQLGYAVLSVLEGMSSPNTALVFKHKLQSGAPLAIWQQEVFPSSTVLSSRLIRVPMKIKHLGTLDDIERQIRDCSDQVLTERLWRMRGIRKTIGQMEEAASPLWIWRIGDTVLVAQPNEAYSPFQMVLRKHFQDRKVVVANIVNGYVGYLPPVDMYDRNQYAVWQTPFEAGSLELMIETACSAIERVIREER